jgi:hypothetical protein
MKTIDLLKSLADTIDARRASSHAARNARLAYEHAAANTSSQQLDSLWSASRAATAAGMRAQAAHDNMLAAVRVHLATQ